MKNENMANEKPKKETTKEELQETFLNALNMCFPEGRLERLSPELRAQLLKVKDDLNAKLKPLPPIDGAQESIWGLNGLLEAFCAMMDAEKAAREYETNMSMKQSTNSDHEKEYEAEIKRRIDSGELLTKSSHELAVNAAKEAAKSEFQSAQDKMEAERKEKNRIQELRQKKIDDAGLVRPHASLNNVLGGTEEEFDKVLATAKSRKEEFKGKFAEESEIWGRILYASDNDLAIIKQVLGANLNKNSATPEVKTEPLATGSHEKTESAVGTRQTEGGLKFSIVC